MKKELSTTNEILLMGLSTLNVTQIQCALDLNASLLEVDDFLSKNGGVLNFVLEVATQKRSKVVCDIKEKNISIKNLKNIPSPKEFTRMVKEKTNLIDDDVFNVFRKILKQKDEVIPLEHKFEGMTPLLIASSLGIGSVVTYLIKKGADVEAIAPMKRTALHWACIMGNSGTVKRLCGLNANLNAKDDESNTPAILAAKNGNILVMRELVRANANFNAVGASGLTAAQELVRLDKGRGYEWIEWERDYRNDIVEKHLKKNIHTSQKIPKVKSRL